MDLRFLVAVDLFVVIFYKVCQKANDERQLIQWQAMVCKITTRNGSWVYWNFPKGRPRQERKHDCLLTFFMSTDACEGLATEEGGGESTISFSTPFCLAIDSTKRGSNFSPPLPKVPTGDWVRLCRRTAICYKQWTEMQLKENPCIIMKGKNNIWLFSWRVRLTKAFTYRMYVQTNDILHKYVYTGL